MLEPRHLNKGQIHMFNARVVAVLLSSLLLLPGCATNPVTGSSDLVLGCKQGRELRELTSAPRGHVRRSILISARAE